ncbi:MAG: hypothetical protein FJ265_23345, partial [Planctomycetes bacterium]|nr:hypothetical protein [Planctomycetota bacterium]
DGFVQRLYDVVHHAKPWVQVGISPFGIARPGVPAGIQAGVDQYAQLYADVQRWLHEGWLDYLAPQLYWPIDQKPQSFAVLLPWWHAQNRLQRHVWPGLDPGRMLQAKPPIRAGELTDQLALLRAQPVSQGHVHFSIKALRTDAPHVAGALRAGLYAEPAVAPASAWLTAPVPGPTDARVERAGDAAAVVWRADPATRFVAVQVLGERHWTTHAVVGGTTGRCVLPAGTRAVQVTPLSRASVAGPAATLPVP